MIFPQHPKRDQNLKFTPLSETTSTPTFFIFESPHPPLPGPASPATHNRSYSVCKHCVFFLLFESSITHSRRQWSCLSCTMIVNTPSCYRHDRSGIFLFSKIFPAPAALALHNRKNSKPSLKSYYNVWILAKEVVINTSTV